ALEHIIGRPDAAHNQMVIGRPPVGTGYRGCSGAEIVFTGSIPSDSQSTRAKRTAALINNAVRFRECAEPSDQTDIDRGVAADVVGRLVTWMVGRQIDAIADDQHSGAVERAAAVVDGGWRITSVNNVP